MRVAPLLMVFAVAALSGCVSVDSQTTYYDDPGDDCWFFCGGDSYTVEYDFTPVLVPLLVVAIIIGIIIAIAAAGQREGGQQQQQQVVVVQKKE